MGYMWKNYKTIDREEYIVSFYVVCKENESVEESCTDKYYMEVVHLDYDTHFETKVINKIIADELHEILEYKYLDYYTIEDMLFEDRLLAD